MNPEFWHKRWAERQIGFDQPRPNPLLLKHFNSLNLELGSRIFVPLTGKTIDAAWLLSEGFQVVGVELNETAVKELFEELSAEPEISKTENFRIYSADNINIFVGDFFKLSAEMVEKVDAVYDRAALVALPKEMRKDYCTHLRNITKKAPQFLIVFEYDQGLVSGPPFSITQEEIHQHYGASYSVQLLESVEMPGGLKGQVKANENIWTLVTK
ncbi:MAG: thiopurine S-methyltransferase [Balneolaceae bacterium]|nr:thiopurine S-methyltransferase [Balneolaceae bacterium]MBO6544923.1 thiopurine S-methyltransferase [Balneolaceae bacterium]MBO6646319.1 thiopurine S-methyltransferase [Balneolaceae bacterium]